MTIPTKSEGATEDLSLSNRLKKKKQMQKKDNFDSDEEWQKYIFNTNTNIFLCTCIALTGDAKVLSRWCERMNWEVVIKD